MGLFYHGDSVVTRTVARVPETVPEGHYIDVGAVKDAIRAKAITNDRKLQEAFQSLVETHTTLKAGKDVQVTTETTKTKIPGPDPRTLVPGILIVAAIFIGAWVLDSNGTHAKIRDALLIMAQAGFVGVLALLGIEGGKKPS